MFVILSSTINLKKHWFSLLLENQLINLKIDNIGTQRLHTSAQQGPVFPLSGQAAAWDVIKAKHSDYKYDTFFLYTH